MCEARAMSDPYLLLWLEAPLQAWGHDSKFGRRDSLAFPTRSGVLGLLFCALGWGGERSGELAEFAELDMQLTAYLPCNHEGRPMLRQPLLRDFHMVGSGYDDSDPWETMLIPKKSDGGKAVGGGAKMTYRYYLQDMAYAVALQVPKKWAETICLALQYPVWSLYLGRKNCVPTERIMHGEFPGADAALQQAGKLAKEKNLALSFTVLQGEHEGDEILVLNDVPVRFGSDKRYRDRRVTLIHERT
jgi:CRISPR system Cascade subunit CasD